MIISLGLLLTSSAALQKKEGYRSHEVWLYHTAFFLLNDCPQLTEVELRCHSLGFISDPPCMGHMHDLLRTHRKP
jgi:hypothetical protein